MIWLLAAPIISKGVEKLVFAIASLICVLLIGASSVGLLVQPWSPWWLSGAATVADQPISAPATAAAPVTAPVPTLGVLQPNSVVEGVIALGMTWLGVPYLWGGCDRRGVDCSCFTRNIFGPMGISLPRTTTEQIRVARPVSASEARAGDLVFFDNTCTGCGANPTHVGVVLGGGRMIDAGDPVKIEPIYGGHNARYGRVMS